MRLIVLLMTLFTASFTVSAQTAITGVGTLDQISAKPEYTAKLKPLVAEFTKAQEALNAKMILLPEAKAVQDAKAAYDKAVAALTTAAEKLPEREAAKVAEARLLDHMYQAQAEHSLNSRKYRPVLSANGELAFVKIEPPKE
jgi:hypothetical protein